MKKIVFIIMVLVCSLSSIGQGDKIPIVFKIPFNKHLVNYYSPPNNYTNILARYRWVGGMFDSGLHIPSYNGVPVGTRTSVWPWDGAIAMDTTNHRLYIFSGNAWNRVANYADFGADLTATNSTLTFSGTYNGTTARNIGLNLSNANTWTADISVPDEVYDATAWNGSVEVPTKNAIRDKIETLSSTDTHFGNANLTFTGDRSHLMAGNSLRLSSGGLGQFWIEPDSRYRFGSFEDEVGAAMGLDIDNVAQTASLGSLTGNTILFIDADDGIINFKIGGSKYFELNSTTEVYEFGDLDIGTNGSKIKIDDINEKIFFKEGSLAGASVNWVWTLQNTTTGEGAWEAGGGGGSGTVTDVSVVDANGFTGSVATSTTTPAITLNINSPAFETWYQETLDMTSSVYGSFYWVSSGTGSAISGFTTSAVPLGWTSGHILATGTTTTGLACHYKQAGGTYAAIALSSAKRHNIGGRFIIPILSDGTETFEYYGGWMDDITGSANIVDGIYFSYTHSVSSGQLVFNCENNNTKSTDVGASPITLVAGTEYNWDITVIGGVASIYINGTLLTTISTNIPDDDTNRITSAGDVIIKSAGTTSRSVYVGRLQYGERKN